MVIALVCMAVVQVVTLATLFALRSRVLTQDSLIAKSTGAARDKAAQAHSAAQDALGKADEARKAAGDMREALNKHLQRFLDLESRVDFVYGEVEDAQKTADSALAKASARQTTTPTARPPKKPKPPAALAAQ